MRADAARIGGRPAFAILAHAVERPRDDPRRRRLADAAHAGQHEGMRDAAGLEGVGEGADQRVLTAQIGESRRPVFARQNAIGGGRVAHLAMIAVGVGERRGAKSGGGRLEQRPGSKLVTAASFRT